MESCLAYVMYEEMGNNIYALALEGCLEDPGAVWTSQSTKGTMAKCILFQTNSCDQLAGIMELV
eukprot:16166011-Heterocapsa_arctica.AAC.1